MLKKIILGSAVFFLSTYLYAIEDAIEIAKKRSPILHYGDENFNINLSAGVLVDYTNFNQDQENISQVSKQENIWDLRAARAALYGNFLLFDQKFDYFVACGFSDYLTRDAKALCNLFDATLAYTLPNDYGKITIGKQKEPWAYEMVGDSASLSQHERYLNPLFQSRNIGIRYNTTYMEKKGTFSIGIFNDWIDEKVKFKDGSQQTTMRVTYLPYISDDSSEYIHIGFSSRYNSGKKHSLRFRGKPESNVADYYIDTGELEADHAFEFALEGLWNYKGFSLLGEYIQSNVTSEALDDPSFYGWYVLGSWVLTGENRPYDKNVGYARRLLPQGDNGALELIARYGLVDLNDKSVKGGEMKKWMVGVNWWIDAYWKTSISYGTATLDRFDTVGKNHIGLFRLQWFR